MQTSLVFNILPTIQVCWAGLPKFWARSFPLTERTCLPSRTLSLLQSPSTPLLQFPYLSPSNEHSNVACSVEVQVNRGYLFVTEGALVKEITGGTVSEREK